MIPLHAKREAVLRVFLAGIKPNMNGTLAEAVRDHITGFREVVRTVQEPAKHSVDLKLGQAEGGFNYVVTLYDHESIAVAGFEFYFDWYMQFKKVESFGYQHTRASQK